MRVMKQYNDSHFIYADQVLEATVMTASRSFVFLIVIQLGEYETISNEECFFSYITKSNFSLLTGAFTTTQASLRCFTCGLPPDPEAPVDPNFAGKSCEHFQNETERGHNEKFLVQCAPGTLSCYYATGVLMTGFNKGNGMDYTYMGCSEVQDLPFQTGCHKTRHVTERSPKMVCSIRKSPQIRLHHERSNFFSGGVVY